MCVYVRSSLRGVCVYVRSSLRGVCVCMPSLATYVRAYDLGVLCSVVMACDKLCSPVYYKSHFAF